MTIYNASGEAIIILDAIPDGCIVHRELMGEHYARLKFAMADPVALSVGTYVDLPDHGRFVLTEPYNPKYDTETAGYAYDVQMDAEYRQWKNRIVCYDPTSGPMELSFKLTTGFSSHIDVILRNINAHFAYHDGTTAHKYEVTTVFDNDTTTRTQQAVASAQKYLDYDTVDILSALDNLADAYGIEWWVENNVILFGRCQFNSRGAVTFDIEGGNGTKLATDIESANNENQYANRLYIFGGTKNIPANYRVPADMGLAVVNRRLMLTNKFAAERRDADGTVTMRKPKTATYVEAGDTIDANAVEAVIVFDDIYPKINCAVGSDIRTTESTVNDETTGETVTETYYNFNFTGFDDIRSSWRLDGKSFQIVFTSGSLNGMDFECNLYDGDGLAGSTNSWRHIEIIANDTYGRTLPDTSLHPQTGDTFVLYNWDATLLNTGDAFVHTGTNYLVQALNTVTEWYTRIYNRRNEDLPYLEENAEAHVEAIAAWSALFFDPYQEIAGYVGNAITQANGIDTRDNADTQTRLGNIRRYITSALAFVDRVADGTYYNTITQQTTYTLTEDETATFEICAGIAPYYINAAFKKLLNDAQAKFNVIGTDGAQATILDEAEAELLQAAYEKLAELTSDPNTYTVTLASDQYEADNRTADDRYLRYDLGQPVLLKDPAYFPADGCTSRIIGYELKLDFPYDAPQYICGEAVAFSRLKHIEGQLEEAIAYATGDGAGAGGSSIFIITTSSTATPTDYNVFSAKRVQRELTDITAKLGDYLSKTHDDTAAGNLTFNKNLEVKGRITTNDIQNLGTFVDGLLGEGWRVWMADGRAHAAVDFLTVRQRQTVLELLIERVRATGGTLIVSPAAAKIDTVTLNAAGTEYHIAFETDEGDTALNRSGGFVAHDLIRCSTWAQRAPDGTAGASLRSYWVEVLAADATGIAVLKTQFPDGTTPAAGDECVLMGNTDDASGRQSFIEIAATDDGTPRISVFDGVCQTSLRDRAGGSCLRARLGCLNDISDPDFSDPAIGGYGLYSDNAFLKGDFILTTGDRIATKFQVLEGLIKSTVEAAREDLSELSYLRNTDFAAQLDYWRSANTTLFYATGSTSAGNLRLILTGGTLLSKKGDGADIVTDESRTVCRIRNSYILQRAADFRFRPDFDTDETDATLRVAKPVYLTLYVKALTAGRMTVEIENSDPTGFTAFTPFRADVDLTATDGYVKYDFEGFWNGTGDFRLTYTGAAYFHTLILSTDRAQTFAARYQTVLEQTATFLRAAALEYDSNGNINSASGLMLKSDFSGMFSFAVNSDRNIVKQSEISTFITETEAGELISNATINADQINLEGYTTINGNFHIDEAGNMVAKSGTFEGTVSASQLDITTNQLPDGYEDGINKPGTYYCPRNEDGSFASRRVILDTSSFKAGDIVRFIVPAYLLSGTMEIWPGVNGATYHTERVLNDFWYIVDGQTGDLTNSGFTPVREWTNLDNMLQIDCSYGYTDKNDYTAFPIFGKSFLVNASESSRVIADEYKSIYIAGGLIELMYDGNNWLVLSCMAKNQVWVATGQIHPTGQTSRIVDAVCCIYDTVSLIVDACNSGFSI